MFKFTLFSLFVSIIGVKSQHFDSLSLHNCSCNIDVQRTNITEFIQQPKKHNTMSNWIIDNGYYVPERSWSKMIYDYRIYIPERAWSEWAWEYKYTIATVGAFASYKIYRYNYPSNQFVNSLSKNEQVLRLNGGYSDHFGGINEVIINNNLPSAEAIVQRDVQIIPNENIFVIEDVNTPITETIITADQIVPLKDDIINEKYLDFRFNKNDIPIVERSGFDKYMYDNLIQQGYTYKPQLQIDQNSYSHVFDTTPHEASKVTFSNDVIQRTFSIEEGNNLCYKAEPIGFNRNYLDGRRVNEPSRRMANAFWANGGASLDGSDWNKYINFGERYSD